MQTLDIQQVRRFNRIVGERIGALNDRFLDRERPMGESRVLWEIGAAGIDIRELRRRLGLDSGYVSRILDSLKQQGLVVIEVSPADGRVRRARLTAAGLDEWSLLDSRSDEVALRFLEPLHGRQRERLVSAMAEVERLLNASLVSIHVADPSSDDARWCFAQYFAELNTRFDAGFDPSLSISADAEELTPPAGVMLVASLREQPIGCGALKLHGAAPAELKRMWVAPDARGLGLGRRLLVELEHQARQAGVTVLHLETNGALTEAVALYRDAGYREVERFNDEPYADHWFEKRLA